MYQAFVDRGTAYAFKGQQDRAIKDYDQAIRLNPNDTAAYYGRARAYQDLGKSVQAETDLINAKQTKSRRNVGN
jgi:Flp pilus assembly protein TadD